MHTSSSHPSQQGCENWIRQDILQFLSSSGCSTADNTFSALLKRFLQLIKLLGPFPQVPIVITILFANNFLLPSFFFQIQKRYASTVAMSKSRACDFACTCLPNMLVSLKSEVSFFSEYRHLHIKRYSGFANGP